uniref:Uncharacterized protein n=1 Tax=Percolomonas cosmopolitus TaxID=63605 RepID=A0A7S1KR64_9EUKA|mmetsp:Transcript_5904/g.22409  ORF Transcript_5904/g.22409 Transcript_5904/m.22409 type:complete len:386 (+) Transcript_5904:440-1597(+)|eukprot:CAMPEP_0117443142 /NCGR_PEP_ID=MMETSP0759-20121206/4538_1 /TAXON_ID=63605 /ORGANISM="Percolomonas cosmopolitus, Strain WS" /LENGTH=385 /DNA_ID=CAMNT_0005235099 /DNA_START=880 /DNA_END=2037 /DNA_ORIENTATION=-
MDVISDKFGGQIEFLMRQIFVAMEGVIRKMKLQLDVHLHTSDDEVRRIYQNALQEDSVLLRNLQAPILASEQFVFGLGYLYRLTQGSMSFMARTGQKKDQPLYVLRNEVDGSQLVLEKYFPERADQTEVVQRLPNVRILFSSLMPKEFPHWMNPTTASEVIPMDVDAGVGGYVIALWDKYTLPTATNVSTSSVSPEAGYIVSATPVEAFHQIFRLLSNNLPVAVILVETDTLIMIANNEQSLTRKIPVGEYDIPRVRNPVIFLANKYGNLSQVPEGLVEYKDQNRTGSHIFVRQIQEPYKWTLIVVVDQELMDTWEKAVLIMLGICAALALIASIPICLIAQFYVHSRDFVRERYGDDKIVSAVSVTPPEQLEAEDATYRGIYPQ